MRIPFGTRGLLAAAAVAGGVVYWRAGSQRRSRRLAEAVDGAIEEGRAAAAGTAEASDTAPDRFGQE